jgi:hypothetical protein
MKYQDQVRALLRFYIKFSNLGSALLLLIYSRETHAVWSHETKPPGFCAHMPTVHIPIQFLVVTTLAVNIPHEGATRRRLISNIGHDHPNSHILQ